MASSFVDTVASVVTNIVAANAAGTAPITPDIRLSLLDIQRAERTEASVSAQDQRYAYYAAYYDGNHADVRATPFGDAELRAPSGTFTAKHNFMPRVVDSLVERMQVTAFSVSAEDWDTTTGTEAAREYARTLWRWWTASRMDDVQQTVFSQAAIKGDAYLIVDYCTEESRPRYTFHDALEVLPVYDANHVMVEAYKAWVEHIDDGVRIVDRHRITRYQPGLITKFASMTGGSAYTLYGGDLDEQGQPDGGVIPWMDATGAPLPIPIIHVKNKALGADFGRSDLADATAIQDEINRRVWNTSESISYQGSVLRFAGNAKVPRDSSGAPVSLNTGPGGIVILEPLNPDREVVIGQWQAGNVTALQDTTDREVRTLAAVTATPVHLIWPEGGLPSGESLKTAEAPLVAKCRARSVAWGNALEDLNRLAVLLENTFGAPGAPMRQDVTIDTEWAPFGTRSELTDEQVLALRRGDIGRDQANRERGYSEEEIQRINGEIEAATPPALRAADQFPVQGGQPIDQQAMTNA